MAPVVRTGLLAILHAAAALQGHAAGARRPLIISTDPGVDDSIALLLAAASPELDLRAVCINFGSLSNISRLAHNALGVLALAGRDDVPVYLGAAGPLAAPFHDLGGRLFHGADGLGGVGVEVPAGRQANTSLSAAEAIVEACRTWRPAPLLVSLAPMTNIALALGLEPDLPSLCPDLVAMGGTITEPGNVSPVAEANIANDAEAAQRVFDAGFNLHMAPLDVTMATWLDPAYLESLRVLPGRAGPFVWALSRFYSQAYRQHGFDGGMPLHDPSTLLAFLRPELYRVRRWPAAVETPAYPSATRGLLVVDRRGGPRSPRPPTNSTVAFSVGVEAAPILAFLRQRLASLPAVPGRPGLGEGPASRPPNREQPSGRASFGEWPAGHLPDSEQPTLLVS